MTYHRASRRLTCDAFECPTEFRGEAGTAKALRLLAASTAAWRYYAGQYGLGDRCWDHVPNKANVRPDRRGPLGRYYERHP